jgi:vancomycin resistance protein VanW
MRLLKRPLSSYHHVFYVIVVWLRRFRRYLQWFFGRNVFAKARCQERLPFRVYKHQSVLVRRLGDADIQLQYNKVTNIRLAIARLNGILIRPGETFSFAYLVGCPTERKGYLNGMLLSNGEATEGIGGGICQIANLIHWLCIHSPLTVTERHHHGFDPFPDSGRVVPFGSGASLFYNYLDYQFRNDTVHTFQLLFWLDEKCLNGDLRISEELPYTYHVFEREHEFLKIGNDYYRKNELWRKQVKKIGSGDVLDIECLQKNFSLVKYTPSEYRVVK